MTARVIAMHEIRVDEIKMMKAGEEMAAEVERQFLRGIRPVQVGDEGTAGTLIVGDSSLSVMNWKCVAGGIKEPPIVKAACKFKLSKAKLNRKQRRALR